MKSLLLLFNILLFEVVTKMLLIFKSEILNFVTFEHGYQTILVNTTSLFTCELVRKNMKK